MNSGGGTTKSVVLGVLLFAAAAAAAQAQVEARAAWIRGTVQGQTAAGAFMQLTSTQDASVIGAESPAAGSVEIHEMKMDGNVMRMRAVARLRLPPGKPVDLTPGGYHMMLLGLKRPLRKGDLVPIRLKLELSDRSVKTVQVMARVLDPTATGPH